MDFLTLLLPLVLVAALVGGLAILKRRLFADDGPPAPIPIPEPSPDAAPGDLSRPEPPRPSKPRTNGSGESREVNLTPARLYPRPMLAPAEKSIYGRLLKALPGYVVLPKISYGEFLEARDGSPSENTSLYNRASSHVADFLICDRKMQVLLVCQLDDGTQLPARIQEREKMLHKAGLRLLRWNADNPPDPSKLLNTVQTLEKLTAQSSGSVH